MAIKINSWKPHQINKSNSGLANAINKALSKENIQSSFLLRLMNRDKLRIKLKPEELFSLRLADRLREETLNGNLKCVWTHPANEGVRSAITTMILKAMGMICGAYDFWFIGNSGGLLAELKFADNQLSPEQEDFRKWSIMFNIPIYTFRIANIDLIPQKLEEIMNVLQEHKLYQPLTN